MKSNLTKTDTQKNAMLQALQSSLGVVSTACKQVGISRQTHYEWMREDMEYASSVKDLENVTLDFAESKLHELIFEGNVESVNFFLKTKGKVRGYIERSEIDLNTNKPDLSGLTTEELIDLVRD
jgi:hypothetical protein